MPTRSLSPAEQAEARAHGLSERDIARQLRFFATPPPFTRLVRPCTPGDGIRALPAEEASRMAGRYEAALGGRRPVSFVPASGAASRMFKVPSAFAQRERPVTLAELQATSAADRDAAELLEVITELRRFAFFPALAEIATDRRHFSPDPAPDEDLRPLLRALLGSPGLGYANLPKGLLAFHRYPEGTRTPFEEHLVEAATYARDRDGVCRLHFTVSEEHVALFESLSDRVLQRYGARHGVRYEIELSTQRASTDSLAVEPDGSPFRLADGSLLFRPGGHGALLENLASIDADVVYLKNIDNVVPDHLKSDTASWRRALGTLLLETQARVFAAITALDRQQSGAADIARTLLAELGTGVSAHENVAVLRRLLHRPIRVCGMVANTGEPGGGPFWARLDGHDTVQIVETSQVDRADPSQRAILAEATHFNPVDLVCGLRDHEGKPYDLDDYVDEDAVFIVEKSKDGRPCRSLERPGLWNGAMARWNSLFVEVPLSTFNPVKTVNALLAPAHQPPA